MNLFLQAMLFEKYGPRLSTAQLADCLDIAESTVYNQIAAGTFPVATYKDGGKRFAAIEDVAAHLKACRDRAAIPA
jgi:hypothetical protein